LVAVRRQAGFGYLGILFVVAIGSVALAGVGTLWSLERQREKEEQLLAIGLEFQRAIGLYYERSPGSVKRYPRALDELLKDNRFLGVQRYLRQIYADPMTGKREWGLVQAPEGGIMGVYSLSQESPLKQANFPMVLESFNGKNSYREWQFVYRPPILISQ
jgi:type II secretory pathway pseudopilin PulG